MVFLFYRLYSCSLAIKGTERDWCDVDSSTSLYSSVKYNRVIHVYIILYTYDKVVFAEIIQSIIIWPWI